MLQDMGHTSVVGWVGFESDGEGIVHVVSSQVQVIGARLVVLKMERGDFQLRHALDAMQSEPMMSVSWLHRAAHVSCSCVCSRKPGHSR